MKTIRAANPSDYPLYREWATRTSVRGNYSGNIKLNTMLVAEDERGVRVIVPFKHVLMLESAGYAPNASPIEVGRTLASLAAAAEQVAAGLGIDELVFWGSDANTSAGAAHAGYVVVSMPLLRKMVISSR